MFSKFERFDFAVSTVLPRYHSLFNVQPIHCGVIYCKNNHFSMIQQQNPAVIQKETSVYLNNTV